MSEAAASGEPGADRPLPPTSPGATLLDAGPFADLLALARFERELEALTGTGGVHTRRISRGRALIEIAGCGPEELAAALRRLPCRVSLEPPAQGRAAVVVWAELVDPSATGEER
jgi:hypothetical protein